MEQGINKHAIIATLTRSSHGDLKGYHTAAAECAAREPEFFSHLTAWNHANGQIRDSKVALPVVYLAQADEARGKPHGAAMWDEAFTENAKAHIAALDPRNLLRAVRFAYDVWGGHFGYHTMRDLTTRYLREREGNTVHWDRMVVQHRRSVKELYCLCRVKPNGRAQDVLFRGLKPGIFGDIAGLVNMEPRQAAGVILTRRIPFLVAVGALGAKAKDPALVLAMLEQMSPAEVVTNQKMLERLGVKDVPELRAAHAAALKRVTEAPAAKVSTFKTQRAAEALGAGAAKEMLEAVQQKQLAKIAVEGDWLVIADKSGSMEAAIEAARHVCAALAAVAKGQVRLVFVDAQPRGMDVTGKTLAEITELTRHVRAEGGTSLGCGVAWAAAGGFVPDGIAVVTDGGENVLPAMADAYGAACAKWGKEVPVYSYLLKGSSHDVMTNNMRARGHEVQVFDLRVGKLDYYSLPAIVQTMRTNRYGLLDEVMATPLLRFADVFKVAA